MYASSFNKTLAVAALCLSATQANAGFDITLSFAAGTGDSYKEYFTIAEQYWETVITGYQSGITLTGLTISVGTLTSDGVGGVLGSAGVTTTERQNHYTFATSGSMLFDAADSSSASFESVVMHEMAHVIGFGTLWDANRLVNRDGEYIGANALAAYRTEFNQAAATYVPVELGGGSGTAGGHWNEVDGGGGATGITASGKDMEYELMTGWLNSPTFVSQTTLASFKDLGYTLSAVSAVPEPETYAMMLAGLGLLGGFARRRASLASRGD